MEETGFKDKGVFELMCGTPLVGSHSKSEVFGEKIILGKTSEELLRAASVWRNPTLMARLAHDDDPEMASLMGLSILSILWMKSRQLLEPQQFVWSDVLQSCKVQGQT